MPKNGLLFLALAGAGLLVFGHTYQNELLYWDDVRNICQNPSLFPAAKSSFVALWSKPYFNLYIPVSYSAWWALVQLGALFGLGENCADYGPIFHLANVCLHILNACLVALVIQMFLRRSGGGDHKAGSYPGALGAMIYLLHPLQVETVAWASMLRDLLSMAMSLAAVLVYFGSRSRGRYVLASTLFIIALLAKPSAAALPAVVLIVDVFLFNKKIGRSLLFMWPWGLASLLMAIWTSTLQEVLNHPDFLQRIEIMFFSIGFYLFKLFAPLKLALAYAFPVQELVESDYLPSIAAVTAAALVPLLFYLWRSNRKVLLASALVSLALLLPVSGLVSFAFQGTSQVADRYFYGPMFGVALAASWLARDTHKKFHRMLLLTAVAVLGTLSFRQSEIWRDEETLLRHSVQAAPGSSFAEGQLGFILFQKRNFKEADAHLRESLKLDPENQAALVTLGHALVQQGRDGDADQLFREALANGRNWPIIHLNLGADFLRKGQNAEAAGEYATALVLDPSSWEALFQLGKIDWKAGRIPEAKKYFDAARAINPALPEFKVRE